jgi:hypothetical protein
MMSTSRMRKPYCSSTGRQRHDICGLMAANSSFDPSSGGTGTKLKTMRNRLMRTNDERNWRTRSGTSRPVASA